MPRSYAPMPQAYAPMPQNYAPPAMQGPFGLSALPQPYGAPGTSVASEFLPPGAPAASDQAPPAVNPLAQEESNGVRKRFQFHNPFKKPRESTPPATPAPPAVAAAPKPQPPAAGVKEQSTHMIPTTAAPPNGPAATQLVGGQGPMATPQGPVIICMPAGWQPPAGFTFAPREVTPEVSEDFWPVATRNPLGESEPGGMFRWPKFGPSADDDEPPPEPAKAIVTNPSPPVRTQSTVDTTPPWKKILMARSHDQPPSETQADPATPAAPQPAAARALFSLNRKKPSAAPAAAPVTEGVAQAPPLPEPARAPAPPVVVRRQPSANRISTTLPESDRRLVTDSKNPKLQWRAKGSPRVSLPEDMDTSGDAGPRVAAHSEPARPKQSRGPTPADPALDPAYDGEPPPSAPALEYETPQQPVVPAPRATPAPRAPVVAVRHKSLIPQSLLTGSPTTIPETPPEPAFQLTSTPQSDGKALMQLAPARPVPRPAVEVPVVPAAPADIRNKALLPKMFVEYAASEISLSTKPPAAPTRVDLSTRAARSGGQSSESAGALDSYYAPPVERRQTASREQETEHEIEVPKHFKRSSPHPREFQPRTDPERYAPHDIPPLAKPFWAISEMTKLPKFVTALTKRGARDQPPQSHEAQRMMIAQRVEAQRVAREQAARAEQLAEESDELETASADPADMAAEPPSKRRKQSQPADEPPDDDDDEKPAKAQTHSKTKLAQDDEADQEPADRPSQARAAKSAGDVPARTRAEVKVVAAEGGNAAKISRSKAVRMRKSDGSSVIVYYVANQEPAAADSAKADQAAASPRRRVVRQAAGEGTKLRDNPLR
jgi:hypothetical protein